MNRKIIIPKESRERIWWLWIATTAAMFLIGMIGMARVLINGLQVTGLSDRVPWGLWITQDLSAIGMGAGAFTLS
ncbi:MAG: hypothetical protein ABFS03_14390, partial [Chloroflexota bacterium]